MRGESPPLRLAFEPTVAYASLEREVSGVSPASKYRGSTSAVNISGLPAAKGDTTRQVGAIMICAEGGMGCLRPRQLRTMQKSSANVPFMSAPTHELLSLWRSTSS